MILVQYACVRELDEEIHVGLNVSPHVLLECSQLQEV